MNNRAESDECISIRYNEHLEWGCLPLFPLFSSCPPSLALRGLTCMRRLHMVSRIFAFEARPPDRKVDDNGDIDGPRSLLRIYNSPIAFPLPIL